ncbi:unnamed protein product [Amoebophrya sp. A120]|nr:unnamed protein product [Amoebophrya sp. A120]|eukprot:GSA120T00022734001.1
MEDFIAARLAETLARAKAVAKEAQERISARTAPVGPTVGQTTEARRSTSPDSSFTASAQKRSHATRSRSTSQMLRAKVLPITLDDLLLDRDAVDQNQSPDASCKTIVASAECDLQRNELQELRAVDTTTFEPQRTVVVKNDRQRTNCSCSPPVAPSASQPSGSNRKPPSTIPSSSVPAVPGLDLAALKRRRRDLKKLSLTSKPFVQTTKNAKVMLPFVFMDLNESSDHGSSMNLNDSTSEANLSSHDEGARNSVASTKEAKEKANPDRAETVDDAAFLNPPAAPTSSTESRAVRAEGSILPMDIENIAELASESDELGPPEPVDANHLAGSEATASASAVDTSVTASAGTSAAAAAGQAPDAGSARAGSSDANEQSSTPQDTTRTEVTSNPSEHSTLRSLYLATGNKDKRGPTGGRPPPKVTQSKTPPLSSSSLTATGQTSQQAASKLGTRAAGAQAQPETPSVYSARSSSASSDVPTMVGTSVLVMNSGDKKRSQSLEPAALRENFLQYSPGVRPGQLGAIRNARARNRKQRAEAYSQHLYEKHQAYEEDKRSKREQQELETQTEREHGRLRLLLQHKNRKRLLSPEQQSSSTGLPGLEDSKKLVSQLSRRNKEEVAEITKRLYDGALHHRQEELEYRKLEFQKPLLDEQKQRALDRKKAVQYYHHMVRPHAPPVERPRASRSLSAVGFHDRLDHEVNYRKRKLAERQAKQIAEADERIKAAQQKLHDRNEEHFHGRHGEAGPSSPFQRSPKELQIWLQTVLGERERSLRERSREREEREKQHLEKELGVFWKKEEELKARVSADQLDDRFESLYEDAMQRLETQEQRKAAKAAEEATSLRAARERVALDIETNASTVAPKRKYNKDSTVFDVLYQNATVRKKAIDRRKKEEDYDLQMDMRRAGAHVRNKVNRQYDKHCGPAMKKVREQSSTFERLHLRTDQLIEKCTTEGGAMSVSSLPRSILKQKEKKEHYALGPAACFEAELATFDPQTGARKRVDYAHIQNLHDQHLIKQVRRVQLVIARDVLWDRLLRLARERVAQTTNGTGMELHRKLQNLDTVANQVTFLKEQVDLLKAEATRREREEQAKVIDVGVDDTTASGAAARVNSKTLAEVDDIPARFSPAGRGKKVKQKQPWQPHWHKLDVLERVQPDRKILETVLDREDADETAKSHEVAELVAFAETRVYNKAFSKDSKNGMVVKKKEATTSSPVTALSAQELKELVRDFEQRYLVAREKIPFLADAYDVSVKQTREAAAKSAGFKDLELTSSKEVIAHTAKRRAITTHPLQRMKANSGSQSNHSITSSLRVTRPGTDAKAAGKGVRIAPAASLSSAGVMNDILEGGAESDALMQSAGEMMPDHDRDMLSAGEQMHFAGEEVDLASSKNEKEPGLKGGMRRSFSNPGSKQTRRMQDQKQTKLASRWLASQHHSPPKSQPRLVKQVEIVNLTATETKTGKKSTVLVDPSESLLDKHRRLTAEAELMRALALEGGKPAADLANVADKQRAWLTESEFLQNSELISPRRKLFNPRTRVRSMSPSNSYNAVDGKFLAKNKALLFHDEQVEVALREATADLVEVMEKQLFPEGLFLPITRSSVFTSSLDEQFRDSNAKIAKLLSCSRGFKQPPKAGTNLSSTSSAATTTSSLLQITGDEAALSSLAAKQQEKITTLAQHARFVIADEFGDPRDVVVDLKPIDNFTGQNRGPLAATRQTSFRDLDRKQGKHLRHDARSPSRIARTIQALDSGKLNLEEVVRLTIAKCLTTSENNVNTSNSTRKESVLKKHNVLVTQSVLETELTRQFERYENKKEIDFKTLAFYCRQILALVIKRKHAHVQKAREEQAAVKITEELRNAQSKRRAEIDAYRKRFLDLTRFEHTTVRPTIAHPCLIGTEKEKEESRQQLEQTLGKKLERAEKVLALTAQRRSERRGAEKKSHDHQEMLRSSSRRGSKMASGAAAGGFFENATQWIPTKNVKAENRKSLAGATGSSSDAMVNIQEMVSEIQTYGYQPAERVSHAAKMALAKRKEARRRTTSVGFAAPDVLNFSVSDQGTEQIYSTTSGEEAEMSYPRPRPVETALYDGQLDSESEDHVELDSSLGGGPSGDILSPSKDNVLSSTNESASIIGAPTDGQVTRMKQGTSDLETGQAEARVPSTLYQLGQNSDSSLEERPDFMPGEPQDAVLTADRDEQNLHRYYTTASMEEFESDPDAKAAEAVDSNEEKNPAAALSVRDSAAAASGSVSRASDSARLSAGIISSGDPVSNYPESSTVDPLASAAEKMISQQDSAMLEELEEDAGAVPAKILEEAVD